MKFEAQLSNTVPAGILRSLAPERDDLLLPLPLQQLQEVFRPGSNDPIGISASFWRTGAAAHTDNPLNTQQSSQLKGHSSDLDSALGHFPVRAQGITAAIQSCQLKTTGGNAIQKVISS